MIHDAACVSALAPAAATVERNGIFYTAACWTPDALTALAAHLDGAGRAALADLSPSRIFDAWCATTALFRDPFSAESEAIRPALARFSGLSPRGLEGALEAVLGGVDRPAAKSLFAAACDSGPGHAESGGLVAVFLAGNLPALAVQPLLPALAVRRPILLKSPSAEPLFGPAFVRALSRAEPSLEPALAAITWSGGDPALEAPILDRAATVLAYGEQDAVDSVASRARGATVAYGPKTSLAVVGADADLDSATAGLARDIALFDQRGCLSVQAVYTDGDARGLASALSAALTEQAARWPAGPLDPVAIAGVQQLRLDARLRGLFMPELPMTSGTVIVDPLLDFRPSPGLRSVRVHPTGLHQVIPRLTRWTGLLQGAALAGEGAWQLEPELARLGVSRCAVPGRLQEPDALWHNGGVHPLMALSAGASPVQKDSTA